MIKILNTEFGYHALLLNGIIMGIKGFLSFLSAPLIGALSDIYGRKLFLLITAFFTCVPIPFIKVTMIMTSINTLIIILFICTVTFITEIILTPSLHSPSRFTPLPTSS